MTRYVIDASVAVEYLLRTPAGLQVTPLLNDAFLMAPELMDVEVISALRRAVAKKISRKLGQLRRSRTSRTGRSIGFPIAVWLGWHGDTGTTRVRMTPSTSQRLDSTMCPC